MPQALSEVLGQQIIVENVPGAGSMTGAARVSRADPDGYSCCSAANSPTPKCSCCTRSRLYDAATDFAPVALVAQQPLILIARCGIPAGNCRTSSLTRRTNQSDDAIRLARHRDRLASRLRVCSMSTIGVTITHVPYRGLAPAMQDLLAGRIDYMCPTITTAMAQIESHAVQAPAVLGSERSPAFPTSPPPTSRGSRAFRQTVGTRYSCRKRRRRRSSPSSTRRCWQPWQAVGATARARARRDPAAAGASRPAISGKVSFSRDQDLGCGDQGRRHHCGVASRSTTNSVSS